MKHRFDPSILREYDFRGVVGETISPADAEALGLAFGTMVGRGDTHTVCVGCDGRLSSPSLEAALVKGLLASGALVRRIGIGPTPMLHYTTKMTGAGGGVMVTGSHNPANHNGFKLSLASRPLTTAQMAELAHMAGTGAFVLKDTGTDSQISMVQAYTMRLARDFTAKRPLTVVWDSGNGATGEIVTALTARLPGRHVVINAAIDGHFPAHHPDPSKVANMQQLIETVVREGADLGLAFDADGDRIGAVDGKGSILWGDRILTLLAEDVLAAQPGALILADVKSSQGLFDHVATLGGRAEMCRTGNPHIRARMAETGAPLAGEMSGHIFFADRYYGYDDALYAAIRMLNRVAALDVSLAQWQESLPTFVSTPEIRISCPAPRDHVDEITRRLAATKANVTAIDGVRVTTEDGWWLLRASNTQSVLTVRCESKTEEGLGRLKKLLQDQLSQSGIALPND